MLHEAGFIHPDECHCCSDKYLQKRGDTFDYPLNGFYGIDVSQIKTCEKCWDLKGVDVKKYNV